jgi:hypothetical protein
MKELSFKDGVNTNRVDLTLATIRVIKDMRSRLSSNLKEKVQVG